MASQRHGGARPSQAPSPDGGLLTNDAYVAGSSRHLVRSSAGFPMRGPNRRSVILAELLAKDAPADGPGGGAPGGARRTTLLTAGSATVPTCVWVAQVPHVGGGGEDGGSAAAARAAWDAIHAAGAAGPGGPGPAGGLQVPRINFYGSLFKQRQQGGGGTRPREPLPPVGPPPAGGARPGNGRRYTPTGLHASSLHASGPHHDASADAPGFDHDGGSAAAGSDDGLQPHPPPHPRPPGGRASIRATGPMGGSLQAPSLGRPSLRPRPSGRGSLLSGGAAAAMAAAAGTRGGRGSILYGLPVVGEPRAHRSQRGSQLGFGHVSGGSSSGSGGGDAHWHGSGGDRDRAAAAAPAAAAPVARPKRGSSIIRLYGNLGGGGGSCAGSGPLVRGANGVLVDGSGWRAAARGGPPRSLPEPAGGPLAGGGDRDAGAAPKASPRPGEAEAEAAWESFQKTRSAAAQALGFTVRDLLRRRQEAAEQAAAAAPPPAPLAATRCFRIAPEEPALSASAARNRALALLYGGSATPPADREQPDPAAAAPAKTPHPPSAAPPADRGPGPLRGGGGGASGGRRPSSLAGAGRSSVSVRGHARRSMAWRPTGRSILEAPGATLVMPAGAALSGHGGSASGGPGPGAAAAAPPATAPARAEVPHAWLHDERSWEDDSWAESRLRRAEMLTEGLSGSVSAFDRDPCPGGGPRRSGREIDGAAAVLAPVRPDCGGEAGAAEADLVARAPRTAALLLPPATASRGGPAGPPGGLTLGGLGLALGRSGGGWRSPSPVLGAALADAAAVEYALRTIHGGAAVHYARAAVAAGRALAGRHVPGLQRYGHLTFIASEDAEAGEPLVPARRGGGASGGGYSAVGYGAPGGAAAGFLNPAPGARGGGPGPAGARDSDDPTPPPPPPLSTIDVARVAADAEVELAAATGQTGASAAARAAAAAAPAPFQASASPPRPPQQQQPDSDALPPSAPSSRGSPQLLYPFKLPLAVPRPSGAGHIPGWKRFLDVDSHVKHLWAARQEAVEAREMELRVLAGRGQWPGAHRSSLRSHRPSMLAATERVRVGSGAGLKLAPGAAPP